MGVDIGQRYTFLVLFIAVHLRVSVCVCVYVSACACSLACTHTCMHTVSVQVYKARCQTQALLLFSQIPYF